MGELRDRELDELDGDAIFAEGLAVFGLEVVLLKITVRRDDSSFQLNALEPFGADELVVVFADLVRAPRTWRSTRESSPTAAAEDWRGEPPPLGRPSSSNKWICNMVRL